MLTQRDIMAADEQRQDRYRESAHKQLVHEAQDGKGTYWFSHLMAGLGEWLTTKGQKLEEKYEGSPQHTIDVTQTAKTSR